MLLVRATTLDAVFFCFVFFIFSPSHDAQRVGEGHPSMHLTIYCLHTYTIQNSA